MIRRVEGNTVLITDSGLYEPPVVCHVILRRRARARAIFVVLAIIAIATGTMIALAQS